MVMEMYPKTLPWHLAQVAPSRQTVPCTHSNLGYSRLHQSNMTFFPLKKIFFWEEKNGQPFVRVAEREVPKICYQKNLRPLVTILAETTAITAPLPYLGYLGQLSSPHTLVTLDRET